MADFFSKPHDESDVILVVENKKLHVSKAVLTLVSPVFKAMFESDFKEKESSEIELPGKRYEHFVEFLLCLYPHSMQPVTNSNVGFVLPLAHEYQTDCIMKRSEEVLLNILKQVPLNDMNLISTIRMADKYNLKEVLGTALNKCATHTRTELERVSEFELLSDRIKYAIVSITLGETSYELTQTGNKLQETENKLKETENKLKETENKLKETENELKEKADALKATKKEVTKAERAIRKVGKIITTPKDDSMSPPFSFSDDSSSDISDDY